MHNRSYQNDEELSGTEKADNGIDKSENSTSTILQEIDIHEPTKSLQKTSVEKLLEKLRIFQERNQVEIRRFYIVILNILIVGYLAWATYYYIELSNNEPYSQDEVDINGRCKGFCGIQWCRGYGMLILLIFFVYTGLAYYKLIKPIYGKRISKHVLQPIRLFSRKLLTKCYTITFIICAALAAVAVFLFFDTMGSRQRLTSLSGIGTLSLIGFVFSKHPTQIKWRPVICGFSLQFILGLICIRWDVGRGIFECFGDRVEAFLQFSYEGASFVYGNVLGSSTEGVFAFSAIQLIFFVSFVVSILFYLGAMQWIVLKLGGMLQSILGTTVCESLTCATNIFLGMSESPLVIRPYIKYLTKSEIHAVMSSGFATVSGSVLSAYISYGAEPAHLITSSVMAAPAALFYSKLFYPETEESQTASHNIVIEKSDDSSVLDAATKGATAGIKIVLGICANLVAFIAFVAFLNSLVSWLGYLVGLEQLSFEWLLAKAFIPLAWVIGIEWVDCENVARVIATKSIINEFVAYERLGVLKRNGDISLRSAAIATYAICGFANPSSLGILIGSLSAMCPEKRPDITAVAFRAFISGSIICFITASIAALLMHDDIFMEGNSVQNVTITNMNISIF